MSVTDDMYHLTSLLVRQYNGQIIVIITTSRWVWHLSKCGLRRCWFAIVVAGIE